MMTNEEIIRQAERSRSMMMDFYMIQMEILPEIRASVKELIEAGATTRSSEASKRSNEVTG